MHSVLQPITRYCSIPLLCAGLLGLGGCGGSSSGSDDGETERGSSDPGAQYESASLDASVATAYTYFNLDSGTVMALTDTEAAASTDWHIAFSRYNVILNGGDSGPGNVSGALAAAQNDFYSSATEPNASVFLNATPDSELEHLLASYDLDALSFASDEKASSIQASGAMSGTQLDMGWYLYDFTTHVISLNADNWWLLRSAEGNSYGLFHATALSYDSVNGLDVTFEFDVQPSGTVQFTSGASFSAHIPSAGGEACFDFDSDSSVDCATANWDLKLEIAGRNWNLWTHSGITANGNGGAFGPLATADADLYTSATTSPDGQDIRFLYSVDRSAGVFTDNSWYEYNLSGAHKLWPNYRVYMIDTDSTSDSAPVYALQITSYYSNAGASGFPNIRYRQQ
ncbi:MAG: HmuY family protein [Pseudomonadota bacterium]|nr:HmuY family protein [Pseudomonadota bacterium]